MTHTKLWLLFVLPIAGLTCGWCLHGFVSSLSKAKTDTAAARSGAAFASMDESTLRRTVRGVVRDELAASLATLRPGESAAYPNTQTASPEPEALPEPEREALPEEPSVEQESAGAELRAYVDSRIEGGNWGSEDAAYLWNAASQVTPEAFDETTRALARAVNSDQLQVTGSLF